MDSLKHNPALDEYAGKWVAVRGDVVIAHAADSRDLVRRLRAMPDKGKGVVIQRVATLAEPLDTGAGWAMDGEVVLPVAADEARLAVTHLAPEVYDDLVGSVETPDGAPRLAELASKRRRYKWT